MSENRKYTVEDMFESYHSFSKRLEQRCHSSESIDVDFAVLRAYRRADWMSSVRVSMVAMVLSTILLIVMPASDGYAMSSMVNRQEKVETIDFIWIGYEKA